MVNKVEPVMTFTSLKLNVFSKNGALLVGDGKPALRTIVGYDTRAGTPVANYRYKIANRLNASSGYVRNFVNDLDERPLNVRFRHCHW